MTSLIELIEQQQKEEEVSVEQLPGSVHEKVALPTKPYTEDDLLQDEYFNPILNYMSDRYGVDNIRHKDRREVVEKFTNNMRGFSAGNSIRAFSEVRYLNSLEENDPRLARAGEAYGVFEGMSGLFSGEVSFLEGAEIVQDYARTVAFDPVNILALWGGSVLSKGGAKSAATTAQALAKRAYLKKIAAGGTEKAATKAAADSFRKVFSRQGVQLAKSKLLKDTGVKALTTKEGIRYIVGSTAVESMASIGTDIAYQHGLLKTEVQDEYNPYQTGLAALSGIIIGGVQAGRLAVRGTQGMPLPDIQVKYADPAKPSKATVESIRKTLASMSKVEQGEWLEKVTRGKDLEDFGPDFWKSFVLGNDEEGIQGLADILYKEGYRWARRNEDDKITNFLADVVLAQGEELQPFIDDLNKLTGMDYTPKEFGDAMANYMHKAGVGLNIQSQAERLLRNGLEPTAKNIVEEELKWFNYGVLGKLGDKEVARIQNNLVRLLVSNPATTLRNIRGWGVYSTMNSITDLVIAATYGGVGLIGNNKTAMRKASALASAQRMKISSILDPDMSYEAFMSLSRLHPEMANLTHTHVGGVMDTIDLAVPAGIEPTSNVLKLFNKGFDKYTDFANIVSGVKAQDAITKSIEFNYQMDKYLRLKFNIGFKDFYSHPNAAKMISSEDYAWALTRSITETEKAIFSKSYKGKTNLGQLAGFIEDIRTIPGVGLLMPFGRFFNNTMAFMSDHTGVSLAGKALFGKAVADRSMGELTARTGVGLALISGFMWDDVQKIKEGEPLRPITHLDLPQGRVMDAAAEFPIAPAQAIARKLAYQIAGQEMSEEEANEIIKVITGQLTRNMTTSAQNVNNAAVALVRGESEDLARQLRDIITSVPAQMAQSSTRWLDPVNEAAGLLRGEAATVVDRRQGRTALSKSLRYLDQIVGGLTGKDVGPQKYSASVGKVTRRPTGVLGSKEVEYTDAMKLMDTVGVPYYLLDSYSKAPEADNRYNQLFFQVFESMAGDLLRSEAFLKAPKHDKRELFYNPLVSKAKEAVYKQLESSMQVEDKRFAFLLRMGNAYSWVDLDRAAKDIGIETTDFEEFSLDELEALDYWLKNSKEIKKSIYGVK